MSQRYRNIVSWLKNKRNWKRVVIPVLLIAALFLAGRLIDLDKYLHLVQQTIWHLGFWGPAVYIAIYLAATLLLLPGTPFTILAAFLFGTLRGYVIMVAATTLAATVQFFIARYFAREAVEDHFKGAEIFDNLKEMVEQNRWLAIPFVRLMPFFPFSINNFALGLSGIPFWEYLVISEIIFLPMNAVYVFGAGALYRALVIGEASWVLISATTGAGVLILILGYAGKRMFGKPAEAKPARKA